MDWSPLETFLLVREAKADLTVSYMMQRYRRMLSMGFNFQAFAASDALALQEGDRFLLSLRKAKAPTGTVRNYQKNLQALSRFHGWKAATWKVSPDAKRAPQVYSLTDLEALHRLHYNRAKKTRLWRALVMAHLALGWRIGELAKLRVQDVDAANHRVFLAFPEKGNPQRYFPVHKSFFSPNRAFMSWIRNRPIPAGGLEAVWTYTDPRTGVDQSCTQHYLAKELSLAGRSVGVRANCQRGRPTCLTALIVQKKSLAFVKYWAGHEDYSTLADYVAYVDHGMAKHLRSPGWFSHSPTRGKSDGRQTQPAPPLLE